MIKSINRFFDRSQFISSFSYDYLYIISSPLWITFLILYLDKSHSLKYILSSNLNLGDVLLELTAVGHLFSVYLRAFNTTYFINRFPIRIIIFPIILIYLNLVHPYLGFVITSIGFGWDAYHSSMQTFGFGQILDSRKKIYNEDTRVFDWYINVIVYTGLLGLSANWYDYFSIFESVLITNKIIMNPFIDKIKILFQTFCMVSVYLSLILYFIYYIYLKIKHNIFSPHKHVLYLFTFIACYLAFIKTSNFFTSLLIVNAFHALQYWALVAHTENKELKKKYPKLNLTGFILNSTAIVTLIALTSVLIYFKIKFNSFSNQLQSHPIASIYLAIYSSTAFIHFYFDSFIWSVKEKSV